MATIDKLVSSHNNFGHEHLMARMYDALDRLGERLNSAIDNANIQREDQASRIDALARTVDNLIDKYWEGDNDDI